MARLDTEGLWLQLERYMSPLHKTLSEEGKRKLANILKFWDDLKEKWAEARKKFWSKYDRYQFLLQLRYAKKKEELIKENHQKLEEIWFFTRWKKKQEKFIAEYLKALSLYEEIVENPKRKYERITLEEVQKSGFREWVTLNLIAKGIWDEWAKAIAENLKEKLKEWVTLNLGYNEIWVEWAKALAKIELKEWVRLDLRGNNIWDKWAEAIAENMELKEWVRLDLSENNIWDESRSTLENWVADAKARGINCEVLF